ncbi:TetR family transcriptional regulator [Mycolicibacterium sp. 141076]|jgi:AcrR family transcriptional regulator|uniref:TetR/AcrR family transcriptional regulator n=1 Tax=Mycobacteriaceae TaxID=1762 RepID=UPI0009286439|nr:MULTISPECIES: TetR family transcriptional regulator [Mycolicibacterium]TXH24056.1 MAG: TetR/AcrR family transcriptional regulator [Mycobacterium sp.]SHV20268.1 TetR family transcriptional regulator [Mycobacteroides abscessus subsp. abscessus]MDX1877908.1 TetR family transcriptional regulator [Mycolicibacterium sp. 141076]RUP29814.1 MAG: TetR/AcrR family transcriptional regulator [Mycolicibacterium sp.]UCZ58131.1 TetR family transcriptional regulator [Mycolicibacterium phocaicum]
MQAVGNRDKLLGGALECIRTLGYGATSSRDIARAAGANVASINYHFGGKDQLLEQALTACFEGWTERLEAALAAGGEGGSLREQLVGIFRATVDSFAETRPAVVSCIESWAPALRSDTIRAALADGYARVRDRAEELTRQALSPRDGDTSLNLKVITSVTLAVIDGLMVQWIADPAATPNAEEIVDALAALGAIAAS